MTSGTSERIPTSASLLGRVKDWRDQASWEDFRQTYSALILAVATRKGLDREAAEDVLQETLLSVAQAMPAFDYQPERCSFRTWLLGITRCRIADHYRHEKRSPRTQFLPQPEPGGAGFPGALALADSETFEKVWAEEWENHLVRCALEHLKAQASPKHFQVFYLSVIKNRPTAEVARALGVARPQVYIIKHRLLPLFRKTIEKLQEELG